MKPHIKKVNGLWWCDGVEGRTVGSAWGRWKYRQLTLDMHRKHIKEGA